MALNGSGIRDTARVLKISPSTVIETLKKASDLKAVNAARLSRLARKTICFSKSIVMHDVVIGLFINRFEFGCAV